MKVQLLFNLLFLTVASILIPSVQKIWTPENILLCKDPYNTAISPDGKWVVYTTSSPLIGEQQSSRKTHIWISTIDGSHTYQLTRGDENCTNPAWSPDGKWISFVTDRYSSSNIWLIHPQYGEAIQLTHEKNFSGYYKWSPDSKSIAFLMSNSLSEKEKKAKRTKVDPVIVDSGWHFSHIYSIKINRKNIFQNQKPLKVTTGNFDVTQFDWSPGGEKIVFAHQPTPQDFQWRNTDISVVPAQGGAIAPLVRFPGMDQNPLFSPDGSTVAFVSVRGNQSWGRDFRICTIPAKGGKVTILPRTHDSLPGDIWGVILDWAHDGSKIFYEEVIGTDTQLFALPVNGDPYIQITRKPGWKGSFSLNKDNSFVTYVASDFEEADEVYVEYINQTKSPWHKLTGINEALSSFSYAPSQVIRWKSFDGLEIEGILTYPLHYEKGKRYPLIVELHGAPTGAWYRVFTANTWNKNQMFAAQNYAVLQVNVRGSNGRGKEFRFANLGDWGGGDIKDVLSGVDYLIRIGLADPHRLGIHGWSYGGYLTGMAIARTQRFKAAVIGAGDMDLVSGTGNTNSVGIISNFMGCNYWECEKLWNDRSPASHAACINTPTLFIYGQLDTQLPPSTGLILYRALKQRGIQTQMVIYPRSGHWIYEPKLHIDFLKRLLGWFNEHL